MENEESNSGFAFIQLMNWAVSNGAQRHLALDVTSHIICELVEQFEPMVENRSEDFYDNFMETAGEWSCFSQKELFNKANENAFYRRRKSITLVKKFEQHFKPCANARDWALSYFKIYDYLGSMSADTKKLKGFDDACMIAQREYPQSYMELIKVKREREYSCFLFGWVKRFF